MNYSKIIDLDNVTIEDCIKLYEESNLITVINDGRIVDLKEKED